MESLARQSGLWGPAGAQEDCRVTRPSARLDPAAFAATVAQQSSGSGRLPPPPGQAEDGRVTRPSARLGDAAAFAATVAQQSSGSGRLPLPPGQAEDGRVTRPSARLGTALDAGGLSAPTGPGGDRFPAPGEVLDDCYRIDGELGRGGMGVVLRAFDLRRGLPVAIKVLSIESAQAVDLVRFQREGELAARVDRAGGIVRVHALGRVRGLPYCVMELVDGTPLDELFQEAIAPERLARIVEELARTLASCHASGIIHRDIKPANVLLDRASDRPKLCDFGLARDLDARERERLTRTGDLLGSPAYMAPEQAAAGGDGAVTELADVYALGGVLYEGLCGQPPFRGSLIEVLVKVLREPPVAPSELRPGASPELEAICLRALAKKPAQRYPSAAALAEDLARFRRGESVTAKPQVGWVRWRGRWLRREPRALATLAGIVVLLAACFLGGGAALVQLRGRSQAGARLAAARLACGLDTAGGLLGWRLGLAPEASPPELAWVEAELAGLRALEDRVEAEELAPVEACLAAHARYLRHLAGERSPVPTTSGPARGVWDLAVDARILAARGRSDALARAEAALARAEPGLQPWVRAIGRACVAEGWRRALERACQLPPARVREEAAAAQAAPASFRLEPEHVRALKTELLAGQGPAWTAAAAPLRERPARGAALELVARCRAALEVGVQVELPPALRACFAELLAAFLTRAQGSQRVGLDAVHVANALYHQLDTQLAGGPELRALAQRLANTGTLVAQEPELWLLCLRLGVHTERLEGGNVRLRLQPPEVASALLERRPESQALRGCLLEHAFYANRPALADEWQQQADAARRAVEAEFQDLHPSHRHAVQLRLALALHALAELSDSPKRRELDREAVRVLRESRAADGAHWRAHTWQTFLGRECIYLEFADSVEAAKAAWSRARELARARVQAASSDPVVRQVELNTWGRLSTLAAEWHLSHGFRAEGLRLAREVDDPASGVSRHDPGHRARAVLVKERLSANDPAGAEALLADRGLDAQIKASDDLAVVAVEAALARADLAEARRRLALADGHRGHRRLEALRAQLGEE